MKKQFVYLGAGVDIYMAEHIRRWLSRHTDTVYTTENTILEDLSNTSLFCIPDGDVKRLTDSIDKFKINLVTFVKNGGTLITFCGGSHALVKMKFYELTNSSVEFSLKERVGALSSNSLPTTPILSNVLLFNTTYVPLPFCKTNESVNEISCFKCCDSCCGNYDLRRASMYYVFNDNVYILGMHKETRNPAIRLKYIEKGVLVTMSIIPLDYGDNDLDFVLDSITMHNPGISKFWKNVANEYKAKTNSKL